MPEANGGWSTRWPWTSSIEQHFYPLAGDADDFIRLEE
jgi:hypothetical protein